MDSKEPKEKHVICRLALLTVNFFLDIMEVLRGTVMTDVTPAQAMGHIIQRFLKNISSWACTTKIFIILHRCLQDIGGLANNMAKELKSKEHLLHAF